MIQFNCTKCKRLYRVADSYAAKHVRCKECKTINQVPLTKHEEVGCGNSLAAYDQLFSELAEYEKTAPRLVLDD